MAAGKSPSSRNRKPKTEVQAEFEKIEAEVESKKADRDAKTEEAAKIRESEAKEAVADISVEAIVQRIGNLGIEISKYLSDVSSRLMTGTNLLHSLRETVTLEKKEIERLHQIDTSKTAVDLLVEEYQQTNAVLEKEVSETRAKWAEEQDLREAEKKEFDENLKKQRTREKEEYEYQKALERKKEEDQYHEAQRVQERKNKEKQEAIEKSWALRELALKEQEEQLAILKKESAEFPERLKKETEKSVQEALKADRLKNQQEMILLQKEFEAEKKMAELRTKSLEETVTRQYGQIEHLSNRLEEAKKQVQDIAVKAIEGASGARALSHVNQIAMEQAKTRGTPNQ